MAASYCKRPQGSLMIMGAPLITRLPLLNIARLMRHVQLKLEP